MTDAAAAGLVLLGVGAAHLGYTYVAYPWIMSLLPPRPPSPPRPAHPGTEARTPFVSIVIAARDPGRAMADKITDVLRTVSLECEIVAVLDGPDPNAAAALAALADDRVEVCVLERPLGKAAALNAAVARARGDVLVFTDLRQRVAPGAVEFLVAALGSPDVGAVSGALAIASSDDAEGLYERYWRFERALRMREAAWDSAVGVSGALYALKREFWSPLPPGLLLDDVWVPFQVVRAGRRVAFAPLAVATDVRSGSDLAELARKVRTLTGNYQLIAWMPWLLHPGRNRLWWQFMSHKVLRLLTPLAVVCCALGLLLAFGRWAIVGGAGAAAVLWILQRIRGSAGMDGGALQLAQSAAALLVALVVAAYNAARGHWDVWSDAGRPTVGRRGSGERRS